MDNIAPVPNGNRYLIDFLNISKAKAVIADTKFLNQITEVKEELNDDIIMIDMQNTSKYQNFVV